MLDHISKGCETPWSLQGWHIPSCWGSHTDGLGFWDALEHHKSPSHLFLIISTFHNYPG